MSCLVLSKCNQAFFCLADFFLWFSVSRKWLSHSKLKRLLSWKVFSCYDRHVFLFLFFFKLYLSAECPMLVMLLHVTGNTNNFLILRHWPTRLSILIVTTSPFHPCIQACKCPTACHLLSISRKKTDKHSHTHQICHIQLNTLWQ